LTPEARDLLRRLWAFLENQAQSELVTSERTLEYLAAELRALDLSFFSPGSVAYRHLQAREPALLTRVSQFMESCRLRRQQLLTALTSRQWKEPSPMAEGCSKAISILLGDLEAEKVGLEGESQRGNTSELQRELVELRHRELLAHDFTRIEQYVRDLVWAERAARISCNTRHVTMKYNEMFNRLVTDRYLELFAGTLTALGRPLRVAVKTSGKKGETFKQIVLRAAESASPAKVLSEGEKRAVAVADFLTEVTLDTTSAGIILDDPVTSLDLEWRATIAQILSKEALKRQVIAFTHDLPFVYYLKEGAEAATAAVETHWIKRGTTDDKPGYVFLNNSPALEREYRRPTRARELYSKAKKAAPSEQEALLRDGFGALRTSYEAFIVFELFNEVVMRFDERISFGRLKDIVWDRSIAQEVIEKCEALSRHIEGHLHSDAFTATRPAPELLLVEVEAFEALVKRLRDLRKQET